MVIHVVICGHKNVGSAWVRQQISLCVKRWGLFVSRWFITGNYVMLECGNCSDEVHWVWTLRI